MRPRAVFGLVWFGQLVSALGSGLTSFAVGVEVYRGTGSITQFSLIAFFYFLPPMLCSPFAGVLVDRWDRRRVMILASFGALLCPLWILVLLVSGGGDGSVAAHAPWQFYAPIALGSAFEAFRWPAWYAAATVLVSRRNLGRASGMIELGNGAALVISPIVAAGLLPRLGLPALVALDLATFLFAALTLAAVRFPAPPPTEAGRAARGSFGHEVAYGWRYIRERPGLLRLLVIVFAINFLLGMVMVLITPLTLSFADLRVLGEIQSAAGLGMVAGGITMSVWGGPRRKVDGVLVFTFLSGAVLLAAGLPPTAWLVGAAASCFMFSVPIIIGCLQAIWQGKVPPDVQGRVFAVRRMIGLASLPLAMLVAGPLAEKIFEPWLAPGGLLADTVGRWIGAGPSRGIGFLLIVLGALTLLGVVTATRSKALVHVEAILPDPMPHAGGRA